MNRILFITTLSTLLFASTIVAQTDPRGFPMRRTPGPEGAVSSAWENCNDANSGKPQGPLRLATFDTTNLNANTIGTLNSLRSQGQKIVVTLVWDRFTLARHHFTACLETLARQLRRSTGEQVASEPPDTLCVSGIPGDLTNVEVDDRVDQSIEILDSVPVADIRITAAVTATVECEDDDIYDDGNANGRAVSAFIRAAP